MRTACPKCGSEEGKKTSFGEIYACAECEWYTFNIRPYRTGPKTGRNEKCWCGSDKKYKKCCGRVKT